MIRSDHIITSLDRSKSQIRRLERVVTSLRSRVFYRETISAASTCGNTSPLHKRFEDFDEINWFRFEKHLPRIKKEKSGKVRLGCAF